jgi:hypothetical protein
MPYQKKDSRRISNRAFERELIRKDRKELANIRYAPQKMYVVEILVKECWECIEVAFSEEVADILAVMNGGRYRLVPVIDASDLGIDHTNFKNVLTQEDAKWKIK